MIQQIQPLSQNASPVCQLLNATNLDSRIQPQVPNIGQGLQLPQRLHSQLHLVLHGSCPRLAGQAAHQHAGGARLQAPQGARLPGAACCLARTGVTLDAMQEGRQGGKLMCSIVCGTLLATLCTSEPAGRPAGTGS